MADQDVRLRISGDSRSAQRAVKGLEGTIGGLGRTAKTVAGIAGVGSLVVGMQSAVRAAVDFDRGMRNVNSIARLNEQELKRLNRQVLALAKESGQSPKVLAEGLYDIVSSGFKANDAIRVLRASARAATAGLTTTATASKAITAALNAYHLRARDARKVSDILFQTVNKGVLTFEELAGQMGDLVPAAAPLGVSLEEVGAAMATITLQGVPAAEAATRVKNSMLAIANPSDKLSDLLEKNGFQSGQAAIKALGYDGVLKLLQRSTGGNVQALGELFTEQRGQLGMVGLLGRNLKTYTGILGDMGDATKGAGATTKAFDEQSKSLAVRWDKTKASLTAAAIPLAELLFPALEKGAEAIGTLADKVSQNMPEIQRRFREISSVVVDVGRDIVRFATTDVGVSLLAAAGTMKVFAAASTSAVNAVKLLTAFKWSPLLAGVTIIGGLLAGALTYLAQQGDKAGDAIRGIKAALDELTEKGRDHKQQQEAVADAEARVANAVLATDQATLDYNKTLDARRRGELKGEEGALALRSARQRLADALREERRANDDLSEAQAELTERNQAMGDAAEKSQKQIQTASRIFEDAFRAAERTAKRAKSGEEQWPMQAWGRQRSGFFSDNAQKTAQQAQLQFLRGMRTALEQTNKVASDPRVSKETQNRAASLRDQAAAAIIMARELGRVPTKKEVNAVLRNDKFRGAIRTMLRELGDIPPDKETEINAAIDDALDKLGRIKNAVMNIPSNKTVNVTTVWRQIRDVIPFAKGGQAGAALLTNGLVRGPGAGDVIPAVLSPGEVVLNPAQQALIGRDVIQKVLDATGATSAGTGFAKGKSPHRTLRGRVRRANWAANAALEQVAKVNQAETNLDRNYGQLVRAFDVTREEFITTDADGNEQVNQQQVAARVGEIDQLIASRNEMLALLDSEKEKLRAAIDALNSAVAALIKAIQDARENAKAERKAAQRLRGLISRERGKASPDDKQIDRWERQAGIHDTREQRFTERAGDLAGKLSEFKQARADAKDNLANVLPFDRRDVELDIAELTSERSTVSGTTARPAAPTNPAATPATDQDANLRDLLRRFSLALGIQNVQTDILRGVPQFQRGTLGVATTGLALVHSGERITPAGINRPGGNDGGPVLVTLEVNDAMKWLVPFITATVDGATDRVAVRIGRDADRRAREGRY